MTVDAGREFLSIVEVSQSFTRGDGSEHRVLEKCTLDVPRGQFISIVGPSGSAKRPSST